MDKLQIEKNRHSLSHLMTMAVVEFFPQAGLGVGPVIEDGFYQDYDLPEPITPEMLPKIEKRVKELIKKKIKFEQHVMDFAPALKFYKDDPYKTELIKDLKTVGEKKVSFYKSGSFDNLCAGPHVSDTSEIDPDSFKLTKIAGAYWKGSEKNKMLQRIYGVAFANKKELDEYLKMKEEAEKRDHRKLGKELDLFLFSDLVGAGLPLWTPKGTLIRNLLSNFVWQLRKERGYVQVTIPHITKKDLYEVSGHLSKFAAELFRIQTREGHEFAMKPMNCPHHTQIFDHVQRSYKDMPQRYEETTMVYRDEQTGELSGLSRVRCITQDDAHVFCRESQVKEEAFKIWDIIKIFYAAVGFSDLKIRLSMHDPDHFEKYLGTRDVWKKTEQQIRDLAKEKGGKFFEAKGEAAMYGPKIDFMAKDSLGREWQVATIQIDRNMPERFDLNCVNENGEKERIVMLHCAIMGSIERFMCILIEHTAGAFPVWLSPVQVLLAPVSAKHVAGAKKLAEKFEAVGIRVVVDDADETVGNKVRKAAKEKIPYIVVVGDKELAGEDLMIRVRGVEKQEKMDLASFQRMVASETNEIK